MPPMRCAGATTMLSRDQGRHFLVRIEIRRRPACSRSQVRGRNFGGGIDRVQVGREATHNAETLTRPSARSCTRGPCRPGQGGVGAQVRFAQVFETGQELAEEFLGARKLIPERTAQAR